MTNHIIFIEKTQTTQLPPGIDVCCAICRQAAPSSDMIAGPYNANTELTFICRSHMYNSHQLINLLADYVTGQRFQPYSKNGHTNARFL